MADQGVMADETAQENNLEIEIVDDDVCEPASKRLKLTEEDEFDPRILEKRLNEILCCAVCLDLPSLYFFQCTNGHLMCSSCLSCLLADCRLQKALCPTCSCDVSRTLCRRNLVVEKAISEMPISCPFCERLVPRSSLSFHKREQCQERPMQCKYACIGCEWTGPFHSQPAHEATCAFPDKTGQELFEAASRQEETKIKEVRVFTRFLDLLSCENVEFVDFWLHPSSSAKLDGSPPDDSPPDDSPPVLTYKSKTFTAHSLTWGVEASIDSSDQENSCCSTPQSLVYKLVLKAMPRNPILLSYIVLKGPFATIALEPVLNEFRFAEDAMETPYHDIPCCNRLEARALAGSRCIKLRLAMIQSTAESTEKS